MTSLPAETLAVLAQMLPYMLQMFAMQFVNRITLAFVGNYCPSATNVAAAALGSMYSNVTGLSIGVGMTIAVGSFCAQNHGRGASHENGVVLWHTLRGHALCFVFAFLMAVFAVEILGAVGQPEELLVPVRNFSLIMAFAYPPLWASNCISQVLNSQEMQLAGLMAQLVSSAINFGCAWSFLANGSGFLGIAVANLLGSWASFLFLIAYVALKGKQNTVWQIPSEVSQAGQLSFVSYVRVALPSAASMWAEWWAAEILAVFAGLLPGGEASVAANGLLFNTLAIFYMAFVAVSKASAMRVGFHLGSKDAASIKLTIAVSLSITTLLSGLVALVLDVYGDEILSFYTKDREILSEGDSANLGMVLSVPAYAIMMCLMGVMRSLFLSDFAAVAVAISFYAIGIPTGYYLGLVAGMDLLGLWLGNFTSLAAAAVLMAVKMCTVDYEELVAGGKQKLDTPLLDDESEAQAFSRTSSQYDIGAGRTPCASFGCDGFDYSTSPTSRMNLP